MDSTKFASNSLNDQLFREHEARVRAQLQEDVLGQVRVPDALQNAVLLLISENLLDRVFGKLDIFVFMLEVKNMLNLVCNILSEVHLSIQILFLLELDHCLKILFIPNLLAVLLLGFSQHSPELGASRLLS